jgi:DNA polymerase III subunit epsilon
MGLDFTAVDVETANSQRSSVCSIAMVRVRDGEVVDGYSRLVRPVQGVDAFTNTWVHGIGPRDVAGAPLWDAVLPEVLAFAGSDVLVAHNASFDRSVLARSSEAFDRSFGTPPFVCTLRLARALLDLGSYSLPLVVAELGLPAFAHHDAQADARAAALVAVRLAARAGAGDVTALGAVAPQGPQQRRPVRRTRTTTAG